MSLERRVMELERKLELLHTQEQGGLVTLSAATSDPPTATEISTAFGSRHSGFIGFLTDSNTNKEYLIIFQSSLRFYVLLTQAA